MRKIENMVDGVEYCSANWNDTAANFYTKTGDIVTVQSFYRYGKSPKPVIYTIAEYNAWLADIAKTCD